MDKDALTKSSLVSMGFRSSIKNAKKATIVVASNCLAGHVEALQKAGAKIERFEGTSRDLGLIYGKPFNISVLAISEGGKGKKK